MDARRRARRGARGEGRGRQPLLHGRGLARAEGPRPRQGLRHGRGRARRSGSRPARRSACSPAAQARRLKAAGPRLLQPQPRHLAGILRRDHHHAHLPGAARHARARARRRHPCLLRRHRRHGRERGRPRRHDRDAGEPAGASGESVPINLLVRVAGTPLASGAGRGRARSARLRAHDRGRAHRDAGVGGAALGRARGHERGDAGALLPRRRQLDLLRAEAPDHAQSRPRPRHGAAGPARHDGRWSHNRAYALVVKAESWSVS